MLEHFIKKRYIGPVVDLIDDGIEKANFLNNQVETHNFKIVLTKTNVVVGKIDYRFGNAFELYYVGHIGYRIFPEFRGNSYAYYATKVILDVIRHHKNINSVIITCSPDNIASLKTIERLGAKLIETVYVPSNHYLYRRNEKIKNIYFIDLF